ncbi:hypothetical protein F0L17_13535 [Streptomyces sp. TRM43335]|uniref:Uncharacterized protein n=1 Tax=Streptomyces taklimakanensis TaxID=2569853 RepID=A0A6G2BCW8_9ACTN|nr:hypothetical protein [Streptomyces taklimakanensis]MTE20117.1 hypothetical protein [Streptomyces taklimakanensis]
MPDGRAQRPDGTEREGRDERTGPGPEDGRGRPDRRERRERQEQPVGPPAPGETESDVERRRRRAVFLRELNEAKALRERVQPRRARAARMRQAMRMRTFRW